MIILKGKYNIAKIMLPNDSYLEEGLKEQIQGFLNLPMFKGDPIVIMPDCHVGKGTCIGFTMKMNDYIIPNIVGVDLGCGMLSYNLGNIEIDLEELDKFIVKNIPYGFNVGRPSNRMRAEITITSFRIEKKDKIDYFRSSLGTLGGGNHFIEIGIDEKHNKWLTIHTGSRHFGHSIATYYQSLAKKQLEKYFVQNIPQGMEFLVDELKEKYLEDMEIAQEFATENRKQILNKILNFLNINFSDSKMIESIHNYINFKDNTIRKGAISANKGKKVIIPFNMRDGLIIAKGKGNNIWNNSAPHGAGRILSRKKAKEKIKLEDFKESMKGIYSNSISEKTLDESPFVYKDKQLILENIKDTVEILTYVKPIYNFKAQ